jgi:hypothetical protein
VAVVDPQDGLEVVEELLAGQEVLEQPADHRRAPEAAADMDLEAEPAIRRHPRAGADVVEAHRRAVFGAARDGDLELARQEQELRRQRGPLADDLAVGARVEQLVGGDAGEGVGGDVADAVAGGLDGVHLHGGQLGQDVRRLLEAHPVELDVAAGGEVAVAPVVAAGDVGELAQLWLASVP